MVEYRPAPVGKSLGKSFRLNRERCRSLGSPSTLSLLGGRPLKRVLTWSLPTCIVDDA
jgi:hypothetical protein